MKRIKLIGLAYAAVAAMIGCSTQAGAGVATTRSGVTTSGSLPAAMKLLVSDSASHDFFGYSVAISSDGSTLVVGAANKTVRGNAQEGEAFVFTKSNGSWSPAQELVASDGTAGDYFGGSVAISSDGSALIVGASTKQVGGNSGQGAVYLFTKSGGAWRQTQELTASDGAANDYLGWSVAISGDGNTLFLGASGKTIGGNSNQGAAYVFTKSGAVWRQSAELTAQDGAAKDFFGWSVDSSSDGGTLIVGATNKNAGRGAAYVFTKSGAIWRQSAKLTARDGAAKDLFGSSVAISGDGSTLLLGANGKNSAQGVAYVFTDSNGAWSQAQEISSSDGSTGDYFGGSDAISSDGSTLLLGANGKNYGQGAVYVFTRSGSAWSQAQELTPSDGSAKDFFGWSGASSDDRTTLIVGAWGKAVGRNANQGAVYVFMKSGSAWSQAQELTVPDGATKNDLGRSGSGSREESAFIGAAAGEKAERGPASAFAKSGGI